MILFDNTKDFFSLEHCLQIENIPSSYVTLSETALKLKSSMKWLPLKEFLPYIKKIGIELESNQRSAIEFLHVWGSLLRIQLDNQTSSSEKELIVLDVDWIAKLAGSFIDNSSSEFVTFKLAPILWKDYNASELEYFQYFKLMEHFGLAYYFKNQDKWLIPIHFK